MDGKMTNQGLQKIEVKRAELISQKIGEGSVHLHLAVSSSGGQTSAGKTVVL